MKTMKKMVAALLVLTMVLAMAGTAMAAAKPVMLVLANDATAYDANKKATKNVAAEGSIVQLVKYCGKYAKVIVNAKAGTTVYFKKSDLAKAKNQNASVYVVWAKGGKGMSTCRKNTIKYFSFLKCKTFKVTGHTNLRKNPGLKFKSQGVVEKCTKLKLTGYAGMDDREVVWFQVKYNGKKLWVSENYVNWAKVLTKAQVTKLGDWFWPGE